FLRQGKFPFLRLLFVRNLLVIPLVGPGNQNNCLPRSIEGIRITYIQSSGSLFYNQNGASSGFGTGSQFADLTDGLVLATSDFLVQA
ncbi:MAG: hypothetical protein KME55_36700, partial [Nostoc indistinguendum CM1-VF10]|nr:hypothetical protein [Nostoc indistinguendum CM1-VF10]